MPAESWSRDDPLGLALQDADERTRGQVVDTVRAAFDPFVNGAEVRYVAACWMVAAAAPRIPPPAVRICRAAAPMSRAREIVLACRSPAGPARSISSR